MTPLLPAPAGFERRRPAAPPAAPKAPVEGAAFSQLPVKPAGIFIATPADFSATWEKRPKGNVAIGLRPLSPADAIEARRMAAEQAWQEHDKPEDGDLRLEAYNDALMRLVIARGTCDPNDARKRLAFWQGVEDSVVFVVLTREGARRLFDALEATLLAASPSQPEASDGDILALPLLFSKALLSATEAARLRRLLGYVVESLKGAALR